VTLLELCRRWVERKRCAAIQAAACPCAVNTTDTDELAGLRRAARLLRFWARRHA
jgi:hypothetical protein